MKDIKNFIIEKLKLNRDIKVIDKKNEYVKDMLNIIQSSIKEKEISKVLDEWIGTYDKKMFAYVNKIDYKYRYNNIKSTYNVKLEVLEPNIFDYTINQQLPNKKPYVAYKDNVGEVKSIDIDELFLVVNIHGGYSPIIFEKTKLK